MRPAWGARPAYLSLPLSLGQVDLLQHLRSLLHHQGLLVGVGGDVAVMLRHRQTERGGFFGGGEGSCAFALRA